jgi:hypothetical protein
MLNVETTYIAFFRISRFELESRETSEISAYIGKIPAISFLLP